MTTELATTDWEDKADPGPAAPAPIARETDTEQPTGASRPIDGAGAAEQQASRLQQLDAQLKASAELVPALENGIDYQGGSADVLAASTEQSAADTTPGEESDPTASPAAESAAHVAEAADTSATAAHGDASHQQASGRDAAPSNPAADAVAEALAVTDDDTLAAMGACEPPTAAEPGEEPSAVAGVPNGAVAQSPARTEATVEAADEPASGGGLAAEAARRAADPQCGPTADESPHSQLGLADLLAEDGGGKGVVNRKPGVGTTILGSLTQPPAEPGGQPQAGKASSADGPSSEPERAEDTATDVSGKPPLPRFDSSKATQQQQQPQPAADGAMAGGLSKPHKLHMVGSIPDMSAAWKAKVAVSDEAQVL